jgi:hypothetical protein
MLGQILHLRTRQNSPHNCTHSTWLECGTLRACLAPYGRMRRPTGRVWRPTGAKTIDKTNALTLTCTVTPYNLTSCRGSGCVGAALGEAEVEGAEGLLRVAKGKRAAVVVGGGAAVAQGAEAEGGGERRRREGAGEGAT